LATGAPIKALISAAMGFAIFEGRRRRKSLNLGSAVAASHQLWETRGVFFSFTTVVVVVVVFSDMFISSCSANWRCSSQSENALLGFKNQLVDPNGLFDEWLPGTDCCHWPFVTCRESDGAVIALSITGSVRPSRQPYRDPNSYMNSQQFGSTLAELTELEMLQLQWIFFNTAIPSSWGTSFSDNLVVLIVNDCTLRGAIPPNLGDISKLQHLDLQSNFLTGVVPQTLCNLKHLNYLDVSYNSLQSGFVIPDCFQNRPGLWLSAGHQDNCPSPNHATHPPHPHTAHIFFLSFLGVLVSVVMQL
jgi:hypothetical protein